MNEVFERFAKSDYALGIVGRNETAAEVRRRAA
jgi:hypothetical protein